MFMDENNKLHCELEVDPQPYSLNPCPPNRRLWGQRSIKFGGKLMFIDENNKLHYRAPNHPQPLNSKYGGKMMFIDENNKLHCEPKWTHSLNPLTPCPPLNSVLGVNAPSRRRQADGPVGQRSIKFGGKLMFIDENNKLHCVLWGQRSIKFGSKMMFIDENNKQHCEVPIAIHPTHLNPLTPSPSMSFQACCGGNAPSSVLWGQRSIKYGGKLMFKDEINSWHCVLWGQRSIKYGGKMMFIVEINKLHCELEVDPQP
eukprot:gene26889-4498_t